MNLTHIFFGYLLYLLAIVYIDNQSDNTCNEAALIQQGREQMADTVSRIMIPDLEKLP